MKNLSGQTLSWLDEINIHHRADLERVGALRAYQQIRRNHPGVANIVLLYALQGELLGCRWNALTAEMTAQLRQAAIHSSPG